MIPSTNLEDESQMKTVDKILQKMFPNGGTNIKLLAQLICIFHDNDLERILPKVLKSPMFISCFLDKLLRHFHPTVGFLPMGQELHDALTTIHFNISVQELLDMSEEEQEQIVSKLLKHLTEMRVVESAAKELEKQERESKKMMALLVEVENRKETKKQQKMKQQGKKMPVHNGKALEPTTAVPIEKTSSVPVMKHEMKSEEQVLEENTEEMEDETISVENVQNELKALSGAIHRIEQDQKAVLAQVLERQQNTFALELEEYIHDLDDIQCKYILDLEEQKRKFMLVLEYSKQYFAFIYFNH